MRYPPIRVAVPTFALMLAGSLLATKIPIGWLEISAVVFVLVAGNIVLWLTSGPAKPGTRFPWYIGVSINVVLYGTTAAVIFWALSPDWFAAVVLLANTGCLSSYLT